MAALTGRLIRFAVAVAVVAVVGHDLVYSAAYGAAADAARRATGHEPYWAWTWLVVALAAAVLLAAGLAAGLRLLHRLDTTRARPTWQLSPYLRALMRLWPRLAVVAVLAFAAQENLEHYATHGSHLLGWGELWSGEYALTLPSFGLVALIIAAVVALFTRTLEVLEAAVRSGASSPRRAPRIAPHPPQLDLPRRLRRTLATPDLGRAPPA